MNLAAALDEGLIDKEMKHAIEQMAQGHHGDEIVDTEILPAIATTLSLAAVKPTFEQYFKKAELMVKSASKMEVTDEETNRIAVSLGGEAKKIAKMIDAQCKTVTQEASDFVDGVKGLCKIITEQLVANPKKSNGTCIEITLKNKITAYQSKVELERRKQEEAARKAAKELQDRLDAEAAEANRKAREESVKKAEEEIRKRLAKQSNIPENIITKGDGLLWLDDKIIELPEADMAAVKYGFCNAELMVRELDKRNAEIDTAKKNAADEAEKHEIQAPQVPDLIIPKQETVTRTETGTSSYQVKNWKCTIIDAPLVPRQFCEPSQKFLNDAVKMGMREIPGCKIEEVSETRFRM